MKISVAISSYNHRDFLRDCIDSVLVQTIPAHEIIVVDDNSSDDSRDIIRSYGNRIKPIFNSTNLGGAATKSVGLKHCSGDYIAILDSDDSWLPDKLERQLSYMSENSADACFTFPQFMDGMSFPINETPSQYLPFLQKTPIYNDFLVHFYALGNFLCHSSLLAKREVFDKTGMYDSRFRQLPDFDMWIRFAKVSNIVVLPDTLVNYRYLPGRNSSDAENKDVLIRTRFEHFMIFQTMFDGLSHQEIATRFAPLFPQMNLSEIPSRSKLVFFLLENHPELSLADPAKLASLILRWNEDPSTQDLKEMQRIAAEFDVFHLADQNPLTESQAIEPVNSKWSFRKWQR